ncbi:MAG: Smr/MutS family protein [Balneolaceae bacterium]|nr:Smr/MutS family protein [Balneolaceae bacterium]
MTENEEPYQMPINGVLDLHTFSPSDLSTLVDEFIYACLRENITEIRIIHGKGTGALRRSVHSLLERNPHVLSYRLAGESGGGWGATEAELSSDSNS